MSPEKKYSPTTGEVLDPTEARQASPRKTNFRVLLVSMTIAVVVGIVLVANFWNKTTTPMDYSSGGKLHEQTPTSQTSPPTTPSPPTNSGTETTKPGQPTPPTP